MKRALLTTILGGSLILAACGDNGETEESAGTDSSEETAEENDHTEEDDETSSDELEEDSDDEEFPVTVEDARGEEVTLEEEPAEVISILPSNTELIYGLDAWDQLSAVTLNDDYPEKVSELDTVGDMTIDVEQVIAMEPDLVMAGVLNDMDAVGQIEDAGITVVVLEDTNKFDDLYDVIELAGVVLGKNDEADTMIEDMQSRIEDIRETGESIPEDEQVSVWVEVGQDPLFTTGAGTFLDEMLSLIGAQNAAGEEELWVQFTEEDAVSLNPDVIVLTYGAYVESAGQQVLDRAAWQSVPAVENERVYEFEDANKVNRQGPRLIEGLEELAELIYPEHY
ncbi:ABC transporter substrate-binding protein [Alteribacter lacisalsi]|nr:ABC transporter substrate-binding protein [Alteribacter lacisalsi]